ncbi:endonuclease/exonuclease/phosphatase family protein [Salegentibacter sp.]|uniref:endonuclease/exonuclease/phosphatase family protein n=1 Tax=Salegentibacter sp. TaxID=1903072 RepID=UPI003563F9CD
MKIVEIIILFFTVLMLLPSLASATRFDKWWIRGFDFPRIQICFLVCIVLLASFLYYDFSETWHFIAVGALIFSLGYQFKQIYPYTYLAKKQVLKFEGDDTDCVFSILVSNVLTENRSYQKFIDLVRDRDPDIFLTLESDKKWEKALKELETDYKYVEKVPQDNLYGMHLYSKIKLEDTEVKYLVQDDIPSIHTYFRLDERSRIHLHCLHPKPPSPSESETSTNRDAELLMLGRDIKTSEEGVLVIGDLNDVAWSRTTRLFQKMSGLLDPRIGRGFFNTFHAEYWFLRWPLDHVFHTNDFTLVELARERPIGSDHFPMYIKLNYEPRAEILQDEPEAGQEEKEWAQDKIDDADPKHKEV